METFDGTSQKGDFREALERALQSALEARAGSQRDAMVSYTVVETRGRRGGIANIDELTVVVRVA